MVEIARMLAANAGYAAARAQVDDPHPSRKVVVVTCMDARMDVFAILGLHLGDAHVIRNAGGRITPDVIRSLAISSHVLGTETVVVMQHTKCGLAGVTDEQLREATGADLQFFPIIDHHTALAVDVDIVRNSPHLDKVHTVVGFVYDIESGVITESARYER